MLDKMPTTRFISGVIFSVLFLLMRYGKYLK
jgi:hypothetical protein